MFNTLNDRVLIFLSGCTGYEKKNRSQTEHTFKNCKYGNAVNTLRTQGVGRIGTETYPSDTGKQSKQ